MGLSRVPSKIWSFSLKRVPSKLGSFSPTRPRVQSPCFQLEPMSATTDTGYDSSGEAVLGKRVMVVVDTSLEAKTSLHWALSQGIQNQDTLVLLTVAKPGRRGDQYRRTEKEPRNYKLMYDMKNMCHAKKPEVQVEQCRVEGKDQGKTIVEEARRQQISLLVLGQKKRTMRRRLLRTFFGCRSSGGVADYCVQNAKCMTVAVRRKGRRNGGYLITTQQRKNFWLLA